MIETGWPDVMNPWKNGLSMILKVLRILSHLAKQNGRCLDFLVMPDHVHALVWFPGEGELKLFYETMETAKLCAYQAQSQARSSLSGY
ncbi:MAG: hypothetical protein JRI95_04255 [Deltaproteobacteria bacterium]|nr:hypothetical protein [Deltaproteobacteria bacterium]